MAISRRAFLTNAAALASLSSLRGQDSGRSEWGGPVVDCHHHLRRTPEANVAHLDGAGLSNAMALARDNSAEPMRVLRTQYPGRFLGWFASTDLTKPDAADLLTAAVKNGAIGLGELKSHVAAAGPELRRMYALAAELNIPVLVHFQEVPHTPTEGTFSTGFKDFEVILKSYPKTRFIGHADAFWANISADYANESAYPAGKINPGGITDKWLGDYPNLFADLSANSGNNALSRDPEFTKGFLRRHEDKLIFGSDCACTDGKGGGISQAGNPAAARLAGKCVARETLTLLRATLTPAAFRKVTWDNAHRIYGL
ncbi:MAG TPA: amidohydrolase family protein [Candidatus Sulfopaludibacter sp.]|nr:amidohydrolase family protein [Candidatus Sulfopaludibacter sp.]